MYIRRLLGIVAAATGMAAIVVAAQALVPSIRAAMADHSVTVLAGGGLTAGVMLFVAALMAKLAYRNLFWARYVASQRRRTEHRDHTV